MTENPDETRSEPVGLGTLQRPPTAPSAMQDRLAVHLIWEGVLLITAAVLVIAALATTPGAHFADVIRPVGYAGLIASGLALSLRTGTPNLAVGYIAMTTGALGAHLASTNGWSLWVAMTLAVLLAGLGGLVTGLVTAALSVPAWAVTLGVAIFLQSVALGISGNNVFTVTTSGSYSTAQWLAIFVVVSVGGGALWLIPSVRTRLSMARNAREPGERADLRAGRGVVAGLAGSSLLAGVGGVSMTLYEGGANVASGADTLTIISLGAVLVGGVSVFGRRAGLLGTMFGVVIAEAIQFIAVADIPQNGPSGAWIEVPIGGLVVLGLCVSRALESINGALDRRPKPRQIVPPGFPVPGPIPQPGSAPSQ